MQIGNRIFDTKNHCYVMGILNVTPDSFSDGGKYNRLDRALFRVEEMLKEGADIVDIGGESTRPGYTKISEQEEIERIAPVIKNIKSRFDVPVSLDTYKAAVAEAGIRAGADLINDIWGLKYGPEMPGKAVPAVAASSGVVSAGAASDGIVSAGAASGGAVSCAAAPAGAVPDRKTAGGAMADIIASAGVCCCLMHNRKEAVYGSFPEDVAEDLRESVSLAKRAGITEDKIILDPGVGFGKTYEQNLEIMAKLDSLLCLGYPLLLGCSRKSVIGLTLNLPVEERVEGTLAANVVGILKGCSFIRVHDIKENVRALRMTEALKAYLSF